MYPLWAELRSSRNRACDRVAVVKCDCVSVCKQCRERGVSYSGRIMIRCGWKVNGVIQAPFERYIGHVPIMVKVTDSFLKFLQ